MTREKILEALKDLRAVQMRCFESYRQWMQKGPAEARAFRGLRDNADRNVRVLDYLITEMKNHDVV